MTIAAGMDRYANSAVTDLNGAINNSVTSIVVDSSLGFPYPGPFRILIDNEQMQVTAGSNTTTWTVIRGVDSTSAASHSDEATVTNNITAFDFHSYRSEFNPLSYGALGNGVADDSVWFQNAINDAHALTGGGHIFLPDLPFNIVATLTTYANVVFVTYGAVITGAGAASVTPLIRWSQLGGLTLPGALVVSSGGATISGGLTVASGNFSTTGTTRFNSIAYTWPGSAGSNTQVLTTNGSGGLSWTNSAGSVNSVTGTTNQVTVSPTTGAAVISLPSSGTLPGAWTAASGFTVTTGGMTIGSGGLSVGGAASVSGGITGTLVTGAQPNVTSLGILGALRVSANAANTVPTLGTANGAKIWVQPTDPGGSNGDIWIKA